MGSIESLIPALEHMLQNGSRKRRAETLRRITDLFLEDSQRFGPEHVELFDDVLSRLIIEIESEARAELARRLACVGNAPTRVVGSLARDDDITVAGPVLMQSMRIGNSDLVDIARTKGQAHLLAIAGRAEVGMDITDILVDRGDKDVVRNMADNPGARFSESGISTLVDRAEGDAALAAKVRMRPDIPPQLFGRLVVKATEVVKTRLLAAARPDAQGEISRILNKVAKDVRAKAAPPRDYSSARRKVLALHASGNLGEAQVAGFARSGCYEETVAALSGLSRLPIETIDRLFGGERPDPILILCKGIEFEWATAWAVIQVRAGTRPLSQQACDRALADFERLSFATARRVLRFWQLRHESFDVA
jgi:uncharacterized protein (DUF2336 family)